MKARLFSVTIADCDVETFRAGGPGGQNQNKRDTGVRIRHRASGAVGEARDRRSQALNRREAFKRMATSETFKSWLRLETARRTGALKAIQQRVDAAMAPGKVRVEVRRGGRWAQEDEPREGTA